MKNAAPLAYLLLTAGCVSQPAIQAPPPAEPSRPIQLSMSDMQIVQRGAGRFIGDPVFVSMLASQTASGTVTVCGGANVKNAAGAYTGDTIVIVTLRGTQVTEAIAARNRSEAEAMIQVCRQRGVPI